MKKNFKLFGSALIVLFAMFSCEKNEMNLIPESVELKRANNGMIKSYDNTMVLKWNEELGAAVDRKMPPPAESRIYTMVTLAVHDALNNVVPKFETYALDNSWNDGKEVSKKTIYPVADAAVAKAAHDVLVALFPLSNPNADELLTTCLSEIEDSELKDMGVQIGTDAAAAVLSKRQGDVLPVFQVIEQGTEPGEYRSTPPFLFPNPPVWNANSAYAPYWGQTEPFGILSGDQFRPNPPHAVTSPEYTADYNEVKLLGNNSSAERTAEQTEMVIFLTESMPSMLNRVAKAMVVNEKLNGFDAARLLALTQMTVADAIICSFDGNYHYRFWRPLTAIQQGENDNNPDTEGDPSWGPVTAARVTPAIPSYPSAYSAAGRGGAELFKMYFGTDKKSFTIESHMTAGERSYTSFSQFATDMGISRIYGGHNFRNDHLAGDKIGREVAKYVFENNLKELKPNQLVK